MRNLATRRIVRTGLWCLGHNVRADVGSCDLCGGSSLSVGPVSCAATHGAPWIDSCATYPGRPQLQPRARPHRSRRPQRPRQGAASSRGSADATPATRQRPSETGAHGGAECTTRTRTPRRSCTRGARTFNAPAPVTKVRSAALPLRTTTRRPASSTNSWCRARSVNRPGNGGCLQQSQGGSM